MSIFIERYPRELLIKARVCVSIFSNIRTGCMMQVHVCIDSNIRTGCMMQVHVCIDSNIRTGCYR